MNRNYKGKQALSHNLNVKSPLARQFKSPVCRQKQSCPSSSPLEKKTQIETLRRQLGQIRSEIGDLEKQGYQERELQDHIDKLHEYNEIKDIGVMVLGRLSALKGLQTKDMYEKYGLDLND